MRADLQRLYQRFIREAFLLAAMIESRGAGSMDGQPAIGWNGSQFISEMCVIRLHDAWARFCRELVVISAYARPLTASGSRVSKAPNIAFRRQVIPTLLNTYRRRRTEPDWYIPNESLDAARRLGVTNYYSLLSGLGASLSPSPTEQVRFMRNFYAHRNHSTSQRVSQVTLDLGLSGLVKPHVVPLEIIHSGSSVFSLWVNQLRLMAQLAIY